MKRSKKYTSKKLELSRDTVRRLNDRDMKEAIGAATHPACAQSREEITGVGDICTPTQQNCC